MATDAIVRLSIALVLYLVVSAAIRRPFPTPLDFQAVTAPGYLMLQVAVAVLVLAILAPLPDINPAAVGWGYAAGLAFVAAPNLVGLARRQCIYQFEIRDLYTLWSILPREMLLCGATFPAMALCEEVIFRGTLHLPEPAVAALQWLVYLAGSRTRVGGLAMSCAFLAALHTRTGSLGVVIGAHAALQTLTGRLRSPGLFGGVYPLLDQLKWKNLEPGWLKAVIEALTGAVLVGLIS